MYPLFEVLIVLLLILAIMGLYFIWKELRGLRMTKTHSKQDNETKGQVINVNVGTPVAAAKIEVPIAGDESPSGGEQSPVDSEAEAVEEAEPEPPPPPRAKIYVQPGARATASGIVANKCPKCGMENSTYRSECFNCGVSLH